MRYLKEISVTERKKRTRKYEDELEKPPDSTAVCASNVLAEVVQEDSISAGDFEDQKTF